MLFIKTVMAISGMIAVISGIIIAANIFVPFWDEFSSTEPATNSNVQELMDFFETVFAASMIVLVASIIIWWFAAVSSREYEYEVEWRWR